MRLSIALRLSLGSTIALLAFSAVRTGTLLTWGMSDSEARVQVAPVPPVPPLHASTAAATPPEGAGLQSPDASASKADGSVESALRIAAPKGAR